MKELFDSFEKSVQRFEEILKEEKSIKNRGSAIKRFEFTIELAWKCVQKFLRNCLKTVIPDPDRESSLPAAGRLARITAYILDSRRSLPRIYFGAGMTILWFFQFSDSF